MLMENMQIMKKIESTTRKLSKLPEVKAVYLFGSATKGKMHQLSDIDICVICKEYTDISKKIDFEKGMDIVPFWDLPLAIRFRVFKEGKVLVMKDKMYMDHVKINTLKSYLDFKQLIDRYCWEKFGCTT